MGQEELLLLRQCLFAILSYNQFGNLPEMVGDPDTVPVPLVTLALPLTMLLLKVKRSV